MLQSIRDHTHGWIAGVIISLLILSFALWGIHSYFVSGSVNPSVAEVNGTEITKTQLGIAYERLRRQLQSSPYESPNDTDLQKRALEALINIQVLKDASLNQKYRISSKQIDNYLMNLPEFQVNGRFSVDRFKEILATTSYTASDFLDLIKTALLIDQPKLGLIFSSFSLPYEVEEAISLVNQERNIQFMILSHELFADKPIIISPDKIATYYQKHQDEFKTPEQVNLEYLELSGKDLLATVQSTDEELKSFYKENSNTFVKPLQWKVETITIPIAANAPENQVMDAKNKANDIYNKAKEGVDFGALEKLYSLKHINIIDKKPITEVVTQKNRVNIIDKQAAEQMITQNDLPTELQKAILTLSSPGQVSAPVRIKKIGFVLLKALDVKEAEILPFSQAKDRVKEALAHQKIIQQFTEKREKLTNLTYEHPDSLLPAAKELGLTIKESGLLSKDKGGTGISANPKIREIAFGNDVLNLRNNSDIIQISPDDVIVIRIKTHIPPTVLSLSSVQASIENKLRNNEIDASVLRTANNIIQQLHKGENPASLMQPYKLKWSPASWIARHSTQVDSAILDDAFQVPKPDNSKATYSVAKLSNGYAIIALLAVREGKFNNQEEYDVFAEQTQNAQGLLEYELYKQSLMSNAKIVIRESQ